MKDGLLDGLEIAVLIPCYNEAETITAVVAGFRTALPGARIHVYDNNSDDQTALRAALAGAFVTRETRQGKGHVVRRMFADIEADIYLMADGDGTYAPEDGADLIRTLLTEGSDMVVGTRRDVTRDAGRRGHALGNALFNRLYRAIFGKDFSDIFSGYRAFSRRFVKSFPAISNGFEIETEMSVHASSLRLPVSELELDYGRRPEGSSSKLSTWRDGGKILWMLSMLMKETRPFAFFSAISLAMSALSIVLMVPVVSEYFATGLVPKLPTWMLAIGLMLMALVVLAAGIILDSVARGRVEQKRMVYLALPALGGQRQRARDNARLPASFHGPADEKADAEDDGRAKPIRAA
ncbi:glycosyltransferase [Pseudohoeflea coraliihabitans]|uniref:Glycosyltransferase n=1 Tax=Pseudohoeflea coraliihabitans TaxID=2860393 RepID=A0ABS6WNZ8_9HYPH|nr:glycosyltransferase [Pseudohoeflea sp. DP4N28-3]MBW3097678.1 glycosyltransferase [Pseudohoeflea sp. DP4N28-3]